MPKPIAAALRIPPAPNRGIPAALAPAEESPPSELPVPFSALRLLPRKLAASLLSVSVRKLDELTANGKIRSVSVGNRRLYRPADLDAFVTELSS